MCVCMFGVVGRSWLDERIENAAAAAAAADHDKAMSVLCIAMSVWVSNARCIGNVCSGYSGYIDERYYAVDIVDCFCVCSRAARLSWVPDAS